MRKKIATTHQIVITLGLSVALALHASTWAIAQTQQYHELMKAADKADEAADTNDTLSKVWAGVGSVCTMVCATSIGGGSLIGAGTDPWVCSGATMAASITDASMTKEFASALPGVLSLGGTLATQSGSTGAVAQKPSTNIMACMSAAMAMLQFFQKQEAAKQEKKTAEENRKQAEALKGQGGTAVAGGGGAPIPLIPANSAKTSLGSSAKTAGFGNSDADGGSGSAASAQSAPCAKAKIAGNATSTIACAISNDNTLPDFVNSPKFLKDFKKASGTDFGTFSQKEGSPSQLLASATHGILSGKQAEEFNALTAKFEKRFAGLGDVGGSNYAGSSGSGRHGGAQDIDPSTLVEGIMGQLMPKEQQHAGIQDKLVYQKSVNRAPAASAEDPKVSLFDRVSYRYQDVHRRFLLE